MLFKSGFMHSRFTYSLCLRRWAFIHLTPTIQFLVDMGYCLYFVYFIYMNKSHVGVSLSLYHFSDEPYSRDADTPTAFSGWMSRVRVDNTHTQFELFFGKLE